MRKAIAIDFDGCLCTDAYPDIGEPNWAVINRAKVEQRLGAGLILWTCREGQLLQEAVEACQGWGLTFGALNESLPDWIEEFGTRPRKVGATEYWDDKAARIPVAHRFFVGGPGDDSIELFMPMPVGELTELEPCPFCGSTNVYYERYESPAGERWRCWCAECLATIDPGTAQAMGQVREMWNRRPNASNNPLTLDELREMDGEPVWVEREDGYKHYSGWALVDVSWKAKNVIYVQFLRGPSMLCDVLLKCGGKIYRRKPEEGTP